MPKTELTAPIAAAVCGSCGDVRETTMVPAGCKACRVAFVGDAPRAIVRVEVVSGASIVVRPAIEFVGLWNVEQRERIGAVLHGTIEPQPHREALRVLKGGQT
jgi:hypothetical protein